MGHTNEYLRGKRQTKGGVLPQNRGRFVWRIGQDRQGQGGGRKGKLRLGRELGVVSPPPDLPIQPNPIGTC